MSPEGRESGRPSGRDREQHGGCERFRGGLASQGHAGRGREHRGSSLGSKHHQGARDVYVCANVSLIAGLPQR